MNHLCFLAATLLAATHSSAAQIYSWEEDTEGWTAETPNAVATSTIGATDGIQSLAVSQPNTDNHMWYSVPTSVSFGNEELQAIFKNATELTIDVSYPDPGYNSWFGNPSVEIIIQGEKVDYVGLGAEEISIGAEPQTVSFPLTVAQAAGMASSSWGQILLKFTYGNGGATSTDVVFYVDNLSNIVVSDPSPSIDLYWNGDVDDQWTSLNWTSDIDGTVPGGPLPTDGTAGIAFATSGAGNLFNELGADQSVKSIVATSDLGSIFIGGTHGLTVGEGGIWLDETAGEMSIDTTGGVVLGADQEWRNNSYAPLILDTVLSGAGILTKSGSGPVILGGSNTHTGGTIVEQGDLILDHADALGGSTASLVINGGFLDLNGLDVTLGALSGQIGGVISNTSPTPSTLTLDTTLASSYACQINDAPGGAAVSLVKKGSESLTSNAGGSFTGSVTIEDGLFIANAWVFNVPNKSSFGNSQMAGRTITVTAPGELLFMSNSIFGNAMADTSLLPDIIINETKMDSSRYNQIGDITLNGGVLAQSSTDEGDYLGYQFTGEITVTGTFDSVIESFGKANHLSSDTVFDVADVTGDDAIDLYVTAPLTNQSGDFGNATGGMTKTGPGTMSLDGLNSYSGATRVLEGVLSVSFPSLSDSAEVEIASGAVLDLFHSDTDMVASLRIGPNSLGEGIYGAMGSGAQFEREEITGDGFLQVASASDPYLQWIAGFTTLTGTDTEKGEDPDHDGLTNFEEFGLDGNPENGAASGKVRSRVEMAGADQALVITLPVRDGATFIGTAPASATVAADGIAYEIGGSNDLANFDQNVSEVVPSLTGTPEMPELNTGWTYRSFRLDGAIGGVSPRGPMGFLQAAVTEAP